jgi:predicted nucleic acid-binding protein
MTLVFLDTTILLQHLTDDDPVESPRATAFINSIEQGKVRAHLTDTVILETVQALERTSNQDKAAIRDALLLLLALPEIVLPGKERYEKVFSRYVAANVSFAAAYHAVLMEELKLTEIVSFDTDFDRIAGLTRREP